MSHDPATLAANTGHGHVFPRPDGVRARCGGPALCGECAKDFVRKATSQSKEPLMATDTEITRPLTEADVRRIVDERIAEAKAREHPSDIARMERERSTRMSEPPPPASARRVARNCATWASGRCEVCGVPQQGFEVDADYDCGDRFRSKTDA